MSARTSILPPLLLVALVLGLHACGDERAVTQGLPADGTGLDSTFEAPAAQYVGGATCAPCHARESELWQDSHHDLAMQEANAATILGDFDDASFTHFGVTSSFRREGSSFVVRTDGPDGELADFEVAYVFGVEPLQQYLVRLPRGRLQALALAWDTRPEAEGGERWFHLYPNEPIPAVDELHWTRRRQNWNFSCAECHSTNLNKGYDEASDTYSTTWSEIDVSCEACHGPGSRHVDWASRNAEARDAEDSLGLLVRLKDQSGGAWVMNQETGIAERSAPRAPDTLTDTCGRCHARRRQLVEDYLPDAPLMDTHVPNLLEPGLYHADGQILDEVYVWGSFVQSKMHAAGVRCTDCHDPHSGRVPTTGNELCNVCHLDERFDRPEHRGHAGGGAGSNCVDCHMPERTYMVVDPRRDHGFHVPRPDLSASLGVPNACEGCHAEQDAEWASTAIAGWGEVSERSEFASLLTAASLGVPGSLQAQARLAADQEVAPIVRASVLDVLARTPSPTAFDALSLALEDEAGLVRLSAVRAMAGVPGQERVALLMPLLEDALLAVRVETARSLADLVPDSLPAEQRAHLERARAELLASERTNADTPEARLNLGLLHERAGRGQEAEEAYRSALGLDPLFAPAAINLSDLLRRQSRDAEGEDVLREALAVATTSPGLHHALGLWLVRAGRTEESLEHLRIAAEVGQADPRLGYVYGVALASTGSQEAALDVYRGVLALHPFERDTRLALAGLLAQRGELEAARRQAQELLRNWPEDPEVRQLMGQLGARGR